MTPPLPNETLSLVQARGVSTWACVNTLPLRSKQGWRWVSTLIMFSIIPYCHPWIPSSRLIHSFLKSWQKEKGHKLVGNHHAPPSAPHLHGKTDSRRRQGRGP